MPLTLTLTPALAARACGAPTPRLARTPRMDTVESCLHLPLHP